MRTRLLECPVRITVFALALLLGPTALLNSMAASKSTPRNTPPVATKIPHSFRIHGEELQDPYFWLRDKTNPAVRKYLEAENRYTLQQTKGNRSLEKQLYREMRSHLKETDLSVPQFHDGFYYYSRTAKGKQYPIYCRKRETLQAKEEVILDLNALASGKEFLALGALTVSDDGNLLAYSTDVTGFREYTLEVKDLRTGQRLPLQIPKVSDVDWAADHRTLFYTTEDDAKRAYRLYRHTLGSSTPDELIYEEKDERFNVGIERSRSKAYLFLVIDSHTTSEIRVLPANEPQGTWRTLAPREQDHEYDVDHHGEYFYIRSNQSGRNFAVFRASIQHPERAQWEPVVAHRPNVMIEGMDFFEDFYVLSELEDAKPQIRITDLKTGTSHRIEFPESVYTAHLQSNPEFRTRNLRYQYESLTQPAAVYDYDWKERKATLLKQTEVPGGFVADHYAAERIQATAPDGTKIPISLVYRKGTPRDGSAPLLLTGYGAYGYPSLPYFSITRLSLLDRGAVVAIAHIRGGGDLGKPWHDAGRMFHKKNTFTDFIACADHLVETRWTSRSRLAIQGGSAGGLLIGAVLNFRPDVCSVAILEVPFVDVINTMLDESLPLTVGEFEEWGNPKKPEDYGYMKTYCPYTNLKSTAYPSILVLTSWNDSQVMYWEPAKYTAKLRTLKTDSNPLLLRVNMAAGHGGNSGRYDSLKERAFTYAFLLERWGMRP